MFDKESAFFLRSQNVIKNFLQTVVIIDDRAFFEEDILTEESELVEDEFLIDAEDDVPQPIRDGAEETIITPPIEQVDDSHRLNAQKIINSFAEREIVCSVIKPTSSMNIVNATTSLAKIADIVVVDWDLGDGGNNALQILKEMSKQAVELPTQLRLFTIYTGDEHIVPISEKVKRELEEYLGFEAETEDDGFTILLESVRIAIFAKPETPLPSEYDSRLVQFEELAKRLTTEFTVMTAGLVANVVFKAFTKIRENSFSVISRFAIDHDAPFLNHRLSQRFTPEDVEEHLVALLAEEFQALMEETQIGSEANIDAISDWLKSRSITEITTSRNKTLSQSLLLDMAKYGTEYVKKNNEHFSGTDRDTIHLEITNKLHSELPNVDLDARFAYLTSMRSFYSDNFDRPLTLGTVVKSLKDQTNENYLLCLTPKCDTVRLDADGRNFLFIPLCEPKDSGKFSIIAKDPVTKIFIRFKPCTKAFQANLIKFSPAKSDLDRILCEKQVEKLIYTDANGKKYQWIGELRTEHVLRIVQDFSNNLARVGLNESEWLRRWRN